MAEEKHMKKILIVILAVLLFAILLAASYGVIFFRAAQKLGYIEGPQPPIKMLVIGGLSQELKNVLDNDKELVSYTVVDAKSLDSSTKDLFENHRIIMLNQSMLADKSISRELGEEIQNGVKQGGKLIVVQDSGIYRQGTVDVVGWQATFGDLMPVNCDNDKNQIPSCTKQITVAGRIYKLDPKHKIMEGMEVFPEADDPMLSLDTFNVTLTGNQIAYIQSATAKEFYPAIVEKTWFGIGKVIYFNYDPGKTKRIFENTIEYLK